MGNLFEVGDCRCKRNCTVGEMSYGIGKFRAAEASFQLNDANLCLSPYMLNLYDNMYDNTMKNGVFADGFCPLYERPFVSTSGSFLCTFRKKVMKYIHCTIHCTLCTFLDTKFW